VPHDGVGLASTYGNAGFSQVLGQHGQVRGRSSHVTRLCEAANLRPARWMNSSESLILTGRTSAQP
jgi:hypothetical protein